MSVFLMGSVIEMDEEWLGVVELRRLREAKWIAARGGHWAGVRETGESGTLHLSVER
jgi:hypothetical protein